LSHQLNKKKGMAEEPVEIELRLNQDIDTEGKKAVGGIDDIAAASAKMKQEFEKNLAAQKKVISDLGAEIARLRKEMATPTVTGDAKIIADKERLTKTIAALEKQLKEAEAAYVSLQAKGKTTASATGALGTKAASAATGVNQLNYSVQQVARELPSLAISPQMFILAISNNLPILQDQLKKTRLQNEALKASGQSTVPVWKQVLKSLVSWQTALVVGITLLTVYGKEITDWAKRLFHAAESLKLTTKELRAMKDELAKGMGSELGKLNNLFDKLKDAEKGTYNYYKAKKDIIEQYGSYLNGLDAEKRTLEDVEGAYKSLTIAIQEQAREKALNSVYEQQGEQLIKASTEQLEKIRVEFLDKFGKDTGETFFQSLKKELQSGSGLSEGMKRMIAGFTITGSTTFVGNTGGMVEAAYEYNNVADAIDKIVRAQEVYNGKIKDAQSILGSLYGSNSPQMKSLIQEQELLLEQAKLMPESTEAEIEAKNKKIETIETEIKRLKELGKTNDKAIKEIEKEISAKEKAADELLKIQTRLEEETAAATIAAMQEGAEKKIAQINAEYDERKNKIAERLEEIKRLEEKTGVTSVGNRDQLARLAEAEKAKYEAAVKAVESEARAEVDAVFADVNERFNSQLENQLNRINAYYAEQKRAIKENSLTANEYGEAVAELEEKRLKELSLAREEYNLRTLDFEAEVALRRQELANQELVWESDKQKKLLQIQLDAALKRLKVLDNIKIQGGDAEEEIKRLLAEIERLKKGLEEIPTNKFAEIADALSAVGKSVSNFVSIFDEDMGQLVNWASDAAGIASSIASGNFVGAAVQALDLIGKIVSANRAANKEIKEFNYELAQQAIDYSLAVIEAVKDMKSETDSVFSTDYGNVLSQSMSSYNQAITMQTDLMTQLGDATVKTGVKKRKFLGITFGTKDIYSDLLKTYPELIDAEGNLNKELAQTLLDSGNLAKESQDLVQNVLDATNAADAAMQQFESTLSSLMGQLGDDLKNVLDDAFANGTDAAEKMMQTIIDYMDNFVTAELYNDIFGPIEKQLQEDIAASYGPGGDENAMDDFERFMADVPAAQEAYNAALEAYEKAKEKYGIDLSDADTQQRSGSTSSLARASQDSIDELSGRIMSVQLFTSDIRNTGLENLNLNREMLLHQRAIAIQIEAIAENTAYCRYLEGIDAKLDDINLKGVKIK
jgi:hypothetical protein